MGGNSLAPCLAQGQHSLGGILLLFLVTVTNLNIFSPNTTAREPLATPTLVLLGSGVVCQAAPLTYVFITATKPHVQTMKAQWQVLGVRMWARPMTSPLLRVAAWGRPGACVVSASERVTFLVFAASL